MRPSLLSPFRWLAPEGVAGRLSIFIFHRVLEQFDPLLPEEPDRVRFERIVGFLTRNFTVMRLSDAIDALAQGRLPAAAACITFDDGYADNLTVAAPVLRQHGVSATFFVATAFIDGGRMWNDTVIEAVRRAPDGVLDWSDLGLDRYAIDAAAASRVRAYAHALKALKHLPPAQRHDITAELSRRGGLGGSSQLMMSATQLRELAEMGMDIGGHTRSHPILATLDERSAGQEIAGGREDLAAWLGKAPTLFAYPNGVPAQDYGTRDVALVKAAGFAAAVSTAAGVARTGADMYQLPRFTPWDRGMARFAARCAINVRNGTQPHLAV